MQQLPATFFARTSTLRKMLLVRTCAHIQTKLERHTQTRTAKRKRESKGLLSQINPGVFVLACEMDVNADHSTSRRSMCDVDLPSVMATWETYGGLVVVKTASDGGGSVVLLADSDGQVVRWTLEERRKASQNFTPQEPPSINYQRRSTRGASSGEPVADYGSRVVEVARCSILPPAAGYGKLRRLVSCGPNDRFVVGALHQAVREQFTFVQHMLSLARVNGLCQSSVRLFLALRSIPADHQIRRRANCGRKTQWCVLGGRHWTK